MYVNNDMNTKLTQVSNPFIGYYGTQRYSYTDKWDEHFWGSGSPDNVTASDFVEYPYCPGNEAGSNPTVAGNDIICG